VLRLSVRTPLCWWTLSLVLAGCASERSQVSPSLMSQLKGKPQRIQQVSYEVGSDDELGTKKIKDPLTLKLRYARVMEQFENFPDAKQHYSDVLQKQPENFEAGIGLARVGQAVGDTHKAEIGFRKALALRPDSAVAQHALGQFHLSQSHAVEALPLLNKAVLAHPNEKSYRYDLAVALAQAGDVNAALPHFKRTIGEAAAHHNIATILRDRGNLRGAERHYRQALSIQPDLEESRHALVNLYELRDARKQYARNTRGGSAVQGTPNRAVTPVAHETMSPRTTAGPRHPLTASQREQRRNQQALTR